MMYNADDTTGLGKGKNLRELTQYVNLELQKIANWFCSNKMALNTSKTKFIVFRTRSKVIDPLDCHLVYNGNEIGKPVIPELIYPIERIHNEGSTSSFKLLGVLFDEYLTFDDHISHLCSKISKSLYQSNQKFRRSKTRKMLYFAMVHSHIVYCINIYSCANTSSLNRLRKKQKEAIRIISNAGFREHTAPLFAQLSILPLDHLIKLHILKFMHSF
jgi:hypothetical protein